MLERPTTCGLCSCGCAVYVEPGYGRVKGLCPSVNHPVSTGRLCIRGWNGIPALASPDRLRTPLVRKSGSLEPASWQEAIELTSAALNKTDPTNIGIIGSPKLTNEECYSLVKLARGVIGTANIDSSSRFYDASVVPALLGTTGVPAAQVDLEYLRTAGSILIVGSNVMDSLPHVGSRILDAAGNGCRIVAADPRVSRLAPQAELFLSPLPGTDLDWVRLLIKSIIDNKLYVDSAPELPGFEELITSLAGASPGASGLDPGQIAAAARLLAGNPPVVVMFGLGVTQQAGSTEIIKALASLATLLGGSVMPLRGGSNAQGASDLGLACDYLPGYGAIADAASRQKWESAWSCRLPASPGMAASEMVHARGKGDIKTLLVFAENLALSSPRSIATLEKAEFVAVSDLYLTETARIADVVFPACSFLEKDGTFTNIERRVQRVRAALEPVGESKPDLAIISDLASALGGSISSNPAEVICEIAANVEQYAHVSYEALEKDWGVPWATGDTSPRLAPIAARETPQAGNGALRLIASRINFPQHTGTMCERSPILAREYPQAFAEINEREAEKLGLRPGRRIRISTDSGVLERPMALSSEVPDGCVHVPQFFGGDSPNALASDEPDPVSGVPVFKGCAVKVEEAK